MHIGNVIFGSTGMLRLRLIALKLLIVLGAKWIPTLFGAIGDAIRELTNISAGDDGRRIGTSSATGCSLCSAPPK